MKKVFLLIGLFFCLCGLLRAEVIELKSGKKVEAVVSERTPEYVKIDMEGISVTYFVEEIARIDGVEVEAPVQESSGGGAGIYPLSEGTVDADVSTPVPTAIAIDGDATDWAQVPVAIVDPRGDVQEESFDGKKLFEYDVTNIKLAHDGVFLYVYMEFAQDTDFTFSINKEYSKKIGRFFFDVDNDAATGGKIFFTEVTGFEGILEIDSGVKCEKEGWSVWGGTFISEIPAGSAFESFMSISPGVYDAQTKALNGSFLKRIRSDKQTDRVAVNGTFLELKVPFEEVGIPVYAQKGASARKGTGGERQIRILFSEEGSGNLAMLGNAQDGPKDNFSEEILWQI